MSSAPNNPPIRGYRTRLVYRELLDRIRRSHLPGDRLHRQVDLAREFGCSVHIVQRALAALVDQGWVTRSKRSGTFVARGQPTSRTVGLLCDFSPGAFLYTPMYREILCGISVRLMQDGVALRMMRSEPEEGAWLMDRRLASADLSELAGLIVVHAGAARTPKPLAAVGRSMPVVLLEAQEPIANCSTVNPDHVGGTQAAIRHLWELGHRRIGFSGSYYVRGLHDHREPRYDAYISEMRDRGIDPPREWILPAWTYHEWKHVAERFLSTAPTNRPTALLVRHATWLILHELEAGGVRIGIDLSAVALERLSGWSDWLTGNRNLAAFPGAATLPIDKIFDEFDSIGRRMASLTPTTARTDMLAMGQAAAEEVLRRWSDVTSRHRDITTPVQFRIGNTTCRPSETDPFFRQGG
ncbi:MAG: GntR family transcriptional regulator [Phycisphaerae bacterium]|nr:GntR family transcriptional regulator [Phycisphaerae bacterium]